VSGYRNVADFKLVLDYVQQKAYATETLAQYIDGHKGAGYRFRDHPQLKDIKDLHAVAVQPLAVLSEDAGAPPAMRSTTGTCRTLRSTQSCGDSLSSGWTPWSEEPIIDADGNRTPPRAWAEKLGLTYRPGMVLFDKGREIARIDGMLYRYRFPGGAGVCRRPALRALPTKPLPLYRRQDGGAHAAGAGRQHLGVRRGRDPGSAAGPEPKGCVGPQELGVGHVMGPVAGKGQAHHAVEDVNRGLA
jgi:hypothetical protein